MSNKQQKLVDPQTGEAIESTDLADVGGGLGCCLGLFLPLILSPLLYPLLSDFSLILGLLGFLALGIPLALKLSQIFHDFTARKQLDRRQQQLLKEQRKTQEILHRWEKNAEWKGVPDGAISRASRPDVSEPTNASLSRARKPGKELAKTCTQCHTGYDQGLDNCPRCRHPGFLMRNGPRGR